MPIIGPGGGGGGGGGSTSPVSARTTTLTSVQLLALSTTPVVVAPAVVSSALFPLAWFAEFIPGGTPYTVPGGTALHLGTADQFEGWTSVALGFSFDWTAATSSFFAGPGVGDSGLEDAMSGIAGKGLAVWLDAAVTAGNGTLAVAVYYVAQAVT